MFLFLGETVCSIRQVERGALFWGQNKKDILVTRIHIFQNVKYLWFFFYHCVSFFDLEFNSVAFTEYILKWSNVFLAQKTQLYFCRSKTYKTLPYIAVTQVFFLIKSRKVYWKLDLQTNWEGKVREKKINLTWEIEYFFVPFSFLKPIILHGMYAWKI